MTSAPPPIWDGKTVITAARGAKCVQFPLGPAKRGSAVFKIESEAEGWKRTGTNRSMSSEASSVSEHADPMTWGASTVREVTDAIQGRSEAWT